MALPNALDILLLLLGFVVLAVSSDWAVRWATRLSDALRLGRFAVGFLFVSLTTSLPELFVSTSATLRGAPGLAIGNALGSGVANLTVIVGAAVLLAGALRPPAETLKDLVDVLFLSALVSLFLLTAGALSLVHGLILLGLFLYFARKSLKAGEELDPTPRKRRAALVSLLGFLGAVAVLLLAAEAIVRSALALIEEWPLSDEVVGLTVVALGTSLPELAIAVRALRRGEHGLALGDLFGASTINLTLVIGVVAILHRGPVDLEPVVRAPPFLLFIIVVWWFLLDRGKVFSRKMAVGAVLLYGLFVAQEIGWVVGWPWAGA